MVGRAVGSKLVEVGHEVRMGSRDAGNEQGAAWAAEAGGGDAGGGGSVGTFAEAAEFGELVVNATPGLVALDVLEAANGGSSGGNLAGKVVWDISNPLDFSQGMPPTLGVVNDDSVGERIQRAFPDAQVVKALNTVNAQVMVDPASLGEQTNLFICGDDKASKGRVIEILETFGWLSGDIIDLGDITGSRALEMYLPLWLRLMNTLETPSFNIRVVRGES
jgi:hypothetical protein